jgi:hypothetical protein
MIIVKTKISEEIAKVEDLLVKLLLGQYKILIELSLPFYNIDIDTYGQI